jgi:hypothetical protein
MREPEQTIAVIEQALDAGASLPYEACAIGEELYKLIHVYGYLDDDRIQDLRRRFIDCLPHWGLDDLLSRQMRDAIRIASSLGTLARDDLEDLLGLCDQVSMLTELGLEAQAGLQREFEHAVRQRLRAEARWTALGRSDCND